LGTELAVEFLDRHLVAGEKIGLDTAPLIYYFNRQEPYFPLCRELLRRIELGSLRAVVSVVTEMELLAARSVQSDRQAVNDVEELFRRVADLVIMDVNRTIARRAAELRARTRIKGLDALIVASALTQGCRYLIGNDSDVARRVTEIRYTTLNDMLDGTA
jgi:predicted nucleic acid-binding protein